MVAYLVAILDYLPVALVYLTARNFVDRESRIRRAGASGTGSCKNAAHASIIAGYGMEFSSSMTCLQGLLALRSQVVEERSNVVSHASGSMAR